MIRRLTAAAIASTAAICFVSAATADSSRHATTYKATLKAVNPAAITAGVADVTGGARLVDGKSHNTAAVHVHHAGAMKLYEWHLHEGTCAVLGPPVLGWKYEPRSESTGLLLSDVEGNANGAASSATFDAEPGKHYTAAVHLATTTNGLPVGTTIACGELTRSEE